MKKEFKVSQRMFSFLRDCEEDSKSIFEQDYITSIIMLNALVSDSSTILNEYLVNDYGLFYDEINYNILETFQKIIEAQKNNINTNILSIVVKNSITNEVATIKIDEEALSVLNYSLKLENEYSKEDKLKDADSLVFFVIALVEKLPANLYQFFRKNGISKKDLKENFSIQAQIDSLIIPKEMKNFLYDLNKKIDISKPCEILGRENEIEKIWNVLLKRDKSNCVVVGKAGVGKTAILEKMAYQICEKSCPKEFYGYHIICVSINSIIAGTTYRGEAEENFDALIKYIEKNDNIILFFDEIHTILGAGACREGEMDLANSLKPILSRGSSQIIGATTEEEYEKYFSKDGALKRRFKKIFVDEPENDEVYDLIKNRILALEDFHKVSISIELINYAILMASCFDRETANPDRCIDLIDVSMAKTKKDNRQNVTKEDILSNYNMDIEMFKKMSVYDKKAISYHEAGHYIVRMFSENIKNPEVIAISIIPVDDYLGVNVLNYKKSIQTLQTKKYFIEDMSICLAGRVAEGIFTTEVSTGAAGDLEHASSIAEAYLLSYGFDEKTLENQYLKDQNENLIEYLPERQREYIYKKKVELISKAYKLAEKILKENISLLEELVSELMDKYILSKEELDKIFNKYVSSKNNFSNESK